MLLRCDVPSRQVVKIWRPSCTSIGDDCADDTRSPTVPRLRRTRRRDRRPTLSGRLARVWSPASRRGPKAGHAVLAAGGNAVDAVVAAALVAGVVAVPSTGIGGYGGHLVVARPGGKVTAIDFNSTAPAAAKPDMFPADEKGAVKGNVNTHGWLAAGVPGVLAGLQLALDKFGTKKLPELVRPAIRHARDGFAVSKSLAASIKTARGRFARDPGSGKLFLCNGEPLKDGERFRNPDLADMLQGLADRGRVDDFYQGKIADRIAAAFRKHGGLVTAKDLADYRAVEVAPLSLEWQGYTVHTPPPTAGGLTVLQALATLKALGWSEWDPTDPATVQARVEALRIAWADRLRLLGDPSHTGVPVGKLLSERYAKEGADRVRSAVQAGKPVAGNSDGRPSGGTIHMNAIDASGMAVALTFTHGEGSVLKSRWTAWGSCSATGCRDSTRGPDTPTPPAPASGRCTTCVRRSSPGTASRSWPSARPAAGASRTPFSTCWPTGSVRVARWPTRSRPYGSTPRGTWPDTREGVAGGGGRSVQADRICREDRRRCESERDRARPGDGGTAICRPVTGYFFTPGSRGSFSPCVRTW